MKKYVILSEKKWNRDIIRNLSQKINAEWKLITNKEDFNLVNLEKLKPDKVFIPHWSYIIPASIYQKYDCIVFHMTDLPYGRGGSPLQNLIAKGHKNTKISAIKIQKGMDTGDIYLKKELSLLGTAEEIFIRSSKLIEQMIVEIIENNLQVVPQVGEVVKFKRRTPEQSNLIELDSLEEVYDYIRMLDAEGYPKAYFEINNFRLEFSRASLKADQSIIADVRIIKK